MSGDRLDDLLASINEQLQSHGLMIKGVTGAVIDATLIESAARPKKTIILEVDAAKVRLFSLRMAVNLESAVPKNKVRIRMRPG